jgi:phosphopantetheinyl transferase
LSNAEARLERATGATTALGSAEVRILTLDSGDSATVRDATRRILSQISGIAFEDIDMYDAPGGKPLLRNDDSLQFSISHSHEVAMVAVTRVAPVGVDVELIRAVPNAEMIMRRFFTPEDAAIIRADDDSDLRFAEAWTRAEARVKVRGASVWQAAKADPSTTVRQLSAPSGFAAAIAVASATWIVSQHNIVIADIVAM